jgi:hypothetical protein
VEQVVVEELVVAAEQVALEQEHRYQLLPEQNIQLLLALVVVVELIQLRELLVVIQYLAQ